MPEAVLSVGPMPEPVSRYQAPLPRRRGRRRRPSSSAAPRRACRSCRRARRTAPAPSAIFFSAATTSLPPATFAGSRLRPDQRRSRCTSRRSASRRSRRRRTCPRRRGRGRRRRRRRRAGRCRAPGPVPSATTRTVDARALLLKIGRRWPNRPDCSVEVVEATVMNVSCACADGAATSAAGCGGDRQARSAQDSVQCHGSSPSGRRRLRPVAGWRRRVDRRRARRAGHRRGRAISSPRRRAWPRLCVTSTISVPAAWMAAITDSISRVAPRVEARRRLVEKQHLGRQRSTRGPAPGAAARRRRAPAPAAGRGASRPTRASATRARARARAAARRRASAKREVAAAPSGAASPAAGTPSPAGAARPAFPARPSVLGPTSARSGRGRAAGARSCPRRWHRGSRCASRLAASGRRRRGSRARPRRSDSAVELRAAGRGRLSHGVAALPSLTQARGVEGQHQREQDDARAPAPAAGRPSTSRARSPSSSRG